MKLYKRMKHRLMSSGHKRGEKVSLLGLFAKIKRKRGEQVKNIWCILK